MICPSYGPIASGYGSAVQDHYHYHHHHHQSVESATQAAIVQSRILEMRKEKSRDAARSRRGKENHEFYELAKLLPLPAAITSQLGIMNKASIIRLTISYLKLREFALNGDPCWNIASLNQPGSLKAGKLYNVFDIHQGTHILQALDGFAFALGQDGRFLYISETVSIYLGLSQVEMTGSSVFDYTHQQDHAELAEQLGISHSMSSPHLSSSPLPPASVGSNATSESESGGGNHLAYNSGAGLHAVNPNSLERQFCIRMKSTLTKRGCQHFKSSGYRVVHVISRLRPELNQRREDSTKASKLIGMVAVAVALPPPSQNEHRLEPDMFVMRLGLDFKILHCEPRISELLDYSCDEVTGRSLYSLVHCQDAIQVRKCHSDLIHKGQVMSRYFRIINKNGGFKWIQTCATLICSNNGTSNGKTGAGNSSSTSNEEQEQSIITVNYIISGLEYEHVIMDSSQMPGSNGSSSSLSSSSSSYMPTSASPASSGASLKDTRAHHKHPSINPSPSSPGLQSHLSSSNNQQRNEVEDVSLSIDNIHGHGSKGTGSNINGQHSNKTPESPSLTVPSGSGASGDSSKRRRFTSSPVRPWRTPSPANADLHSPTGRPLGLSPLSSSSSSSLAANPSSNHLLRHISVIRETPPIVKPQVVPPPYHHSHPAHYHHLVDPYAYFKDYPHHLYKNGGNIGGSPAPTSPVAGPHHHHHHHPWGAYN